MNSSRLYSAVTQYWPRIAAGFIAILGVLELVLGGLTSDSAVEVYITAWAATTGGVWFLFEKAENATSASTRDSVAAWLGRKDASPEIRAVPAHFATLFDRVFGEDLGAVSSADGGVVLNGFGRSAIASIVSSVIVGAVIISTTEALRGAGAFWALVAVAVLFGLIVATWPALRSTGLWVTHRLSVFPSWIARSIAVSLLLALMVGIGVGFGVALDFLGQGDLQTQILASGAAATLLVVGFGNLIFDYQSLIVTRRLMDYAIRTGRLGATLVIDFLMTCVIWLLPLGIFLGVPWAFELASLVFDNDLAGAQDFLVTGAVTFMTLPFGVLGIGTWGFQLGTPEVWILRVSLITTFFTSIWLWLYMASVPMSRIFLRMNSGVGFLLRVTDVENQPFRSMGFVSVLIVSGLFALGLPLVLL